MHVLRATTELMQVTTQRKLIKRELDNLSDTFLIHLSDQRLNHLDMFTSFLIEVFIFSQQSMSLWVSHLKYKQ